MNPATIQEIISLIALAGQAGTELYLKLKAIGELGPDEQANIHNQIAAGIAFDEDVKTKYAQWRVDVGLDPAPLAATEASLEIEDEAQQEAQHTTAATPATVHDSSSTIPPAEPEPEAAAPAPTAPAAKANTVHDSSSTIPPGAE